MTKATVIYFSLLSLLGGMALMGNVAAAEPEAPYVAQGAVERGAEAPTNPKTPTLFKTESRALNHFEFSIPKETTLIRVPDDPIMNAVYNTAKLEVYSNAKTHALFVKPLTDEVATLYLTTQSGVTLSLALTPDDLAPERPILLRAVVDEKTTQPAERALDGRQLAPLAAPDYPSKLSRFVKAVLNEEGSNELECTPLERTQWNPFFLEIQATLKPLRVEPVARCAAREALGLVVHVSNGTVRSWQLHNEALLGLRSAALMGVASTKQTLKATEEGTLLFLISPEDTNAITFKSPKPKADGGEA